MTGPAELGDRILCLVGLRCVGKSAVGERIARDLGAPFADLDDLIAREWARERQPVAEVPHAGEVLARIGVGPFRELEERCLADVLSAGGPRVLATGAGCVESAASRKGLSAKQWPVGCRPGVRRSSR